jgi:hypothetical protein
MVAVCLFFQRCHRGGRGRWWSMFWQGIGLSKGEIVILLLVKKYKSLLDIYVLCLVVTIYVINRLSNEIGDCFKKTNVP